MKPLFLMLLVAASACATTVTLTMGEVATQPINGLAVTKGGVTFTFTDAGGHDLYNASNGGQLTYVQDPTIEGPDEPFSVAFSTPVYFVQFGMAASQGTAATPIATISLYNGGTLVFTGTLNSSLTDPFAEGQFTHSSSTPITSVVITPSTTQSFTAIAFDNLTINTAPATIPTLSWTGMILLASAMLASGCILMRWGRLQGPHAA
jgi:hypothetical protein